jgi:hypothetical protein
MKEVLGRALRALAVAPLNCSLILDAGGLEPLTDMLCGRNADLAHQAVAVLSLLTKVRAPLHSTPHRPAHTLGKSWSLALCTSL